MEQAKRYELPKLAYGYKDLAPFLSEEQLDRPPHQASRCLRERAPTPSLDKMDKARAEDADLDMKASG